MKTRLCFSREKLLLFGCLHSILSFYWMFSSPMFLVFIFFFIQKFYRKMKNTTCNRHQRSKVTGTMLFQMTLRLAQFILFCFVFHFVKIVLFWYYYFQYCIPLEFAFTMRVCPFLCAILSFEFAFILCVFHYRLLNGWRFKAENEKQQILQLRIRILKEPECK